MKKYLILIISIVSVVLLGLLGNILSNAAYNGKTAKGAALELNNLFDEKTSFEAFTPAQNDKKYQAPETGEEFSPEFLAAYKANNSKGEYYLYKVSSFGKYADYVIYVIFDSNENKLYKVSIASANDHEYSIADMKDKFDDAWFDALATRVDLSKTSYNVDVVSGATYSSNGILIAIQAAQNQYALDNPNYQLPSGVISVSQSFKDVNTYEVVYGTPSDSKTYIYNLSLEPVTNDVPEEANTIIKASLASAVKGLKSLITKTNDNGDGTYDIYLSQYGYNGSTPINLLFKLDKNNNKVLSCQLVSEAESSPNATKDVYISGVINQLVQNGEADLVAGATITSKALVNAYNYALSYLSYIAQNGYTKETIIPKAISISQSLDNLDFFEYKVEYGEELVVLEVSYNSSDKTFKVEKNKSQIELTDAEISSIDFKSLYNKRYATSAFITAINEVDGNTVYTVESNGYGERIKYNITVSGGVITLMKLIPYEGEGETYAYNPNYSGSASPYVENRLASDFTNNGEADIVAGATVTSNAVIRCYNQVKLYIEQGGAE